MAPLAHLIAAGLALSPAPAASPAPAGLEDAGAAWTLVFEDRFEGETLDPAVWAIESGAPGHITSSRWPENVEVRGGLLHLVTRQETRQESGAQTRGGDDETRSWTTGHVWTHRTFGDGVFEARLKLAPQAGLNNAFWLFPARHPAFSDLGPGETACEIDVIEATHPARMTYNLHVFTAGTQEVARDIYRLTNPWSAPEPNSARFMVLSIERDGETLIWRRDGHIVRRAEAPCAGPLTVRLSTATASWLDTPDDALDGTAMQIDYVRVWETE